MPLRKAYVAVIAAIAAVLLHYALSAFPLHTLPSRFWLALAIKGAEVADATTVQSWLASAAISCGYALHHDQIPFHFIPGLAPATPWFDKDEPAPHIDGSSLRAVRALAEGGPKIRKEVLGWLQAGAPGYDVRDAPIDHMQGWDEIMLFHEGRAYENILAALPFTAILLRRLPEATTHTWGSCKLSILQPGTHIPEHTGPSNSRLRLHLGVFVPEPSQTKIIVGGHARNWAQDGVLVFDDSFLHEVRHDGTQPRIVLIVDIWHPLMDPASEWAPAVDDIALHRRAVSGRRSPFGDAAALLALHNRRLDEAKKILRGTTEQLFQPKGDVKFVAPGQEVSTQDRSKQTEKEERKKDSDNEKRYGKKEGKMLFNNKKKSSKSKKATTKTTTKTTKTKKKAASNTKKGTKIKCDFDVVDARSLDQATFDRKYRHQKPVLLTFPGGAGDIVQERVRTNGYARLRKYFADIPMSGGISDLIPVFQGNGICWRPFKDWWKTLRPDEASVDITCKAPVNETTSSSMYVFDAVPSVVLSHALSGIPRYLNAFVDPVKNEDVKAQAARAAKSEAIAHDQSLIFFGDTGSGVGFHEHGDGFNVVLEGTKRWLIFDPFREGDDRMAGLSGPHSLPAFSVKEWLTRVAPHLEREGMPRPLECEQPPGSIVYLPEEWPHAVDNCGPTLGFAFQTGVNKEQRSPVSVAHVKLTEVQDLWDGKAASGSEIVAAVDDALATIDDMLKTRPKSNRLRYMRADALRLVPARRQEALEWYTKVAEVDPFAVGALVAASRLADILGEAERSREYLGRALQINPTSSLALSSLAQHRQETARRPGIANTSQPDLPMQRTDLVGLKEAFAEGKCQDRGETRTWHPLTASPWASTPRAAAVLAREAFFTHWHLTGRGPALSDDSAQDIENGLWAPDRFSSSSGGCELRRVDAATLDSESFTRDVLLKHEPVVIVGEPGCVAAATSSAADWSDSALIARAGGRIISAESSSSRNSSFFRGPMHPAKSSQRAVEETLENFLLHRYQDPQRTSNWYLQSTIIPESAPFLPRPRFDDTMTHMECVLPDGSEEKEDIDEEHGRLTKKDRRWCGRMWLGFNDDGRQVSHLHRDVPDNLHCLVEGQKLFTIVNPTHLESAAEQGWGKLYSPLNVHSSEFTVQKRQCLLEPGEYLFLPSMYWHAVVSLEGRNLGLNFWYKPTDDSKSISTS